MESLLIILWIAVYASGPALLISGWIFWLRRERKAGICPRLSFLGFSVATLSSLLAIGTFLYGQVIGGFPYYDPRLMRMYRWGLLLSLAAIVLGIAGVWKASPLRWHAPGLGLSMFLFWFLAASGE